MEYGYETGNCKPVCYSKQARACGSSTNLRCYI
jgi:hypothetical protein